MLVIILNLYLKNCSPSRTAYKKFPLYQSISSVSTNSSFLKFDFQSKRRIKYISNCNYRLLTHTYYIKYSIVLGNAIFNTFTPTIKINHILGQEHLFEYDQGFLVSICSLLLFPIETSQNGITVGFFFYCVMKCNLFIFTITCR